MAIRKPEDIFLNCCIKNRLPMAQKILQCNPEIDHHRENDYAFITACEKGYFDCAMRYIH